MTITRTVVRTWLMTARLPITLAESTLRRGESTEEWPPALAFGAFESGVKQVVGALTRDQDLSSEGRLERAHVTQLRKAAELEAIAEAREYEAEAELRARRERSAHRAEAIKTQARQRQRTETQRREEEKRRAEQKAHNRANVARKAGVESEKAVQRADRSARSARVAVEKEGRRQEAWRRCREEDGYQGREEARGCENLSPERPLELDEQVKLGRNVEVRPLGGSLGCLTMLLVSIVASVLLTLMLNVFR